MALFPTRSADVRRYKIINWNVVLEPRLRAKLSSVVELEKVSPVPEPLRLRVDVDREHRTVGLYAGGRPVGSSLRKIGALVPETGAALVFSQSVLGDVAVFLYPFESEFMRRPEKMIVWQIFSDPSDVTEQEIDRAIEAALCYWRVSSGLDGGSRRDNWRVARLVRRDRFGSVEKAMSARPSVLGKAVSAFFEWWPIVAFIALLGVFGSVVTIVTSWDQFTRASSSFLQAPSTAHAAIGVIAVASGAIALRLRRGAANHG